MSIRRFHENSQVPVHAHSQFDFAGVHGREFHAFTCVTTLVKVSFLLFSFACFSFLFHLLVRPWRWCLAHCRALLIHFVLRCCACCSAVLILSSSFLLLFHPLSYYCSMLFLLVRPWRWCLAHCAASLIHFVLRWFIMRPNRPETISPVIILGRQRRPLPWKWVEEKRMQRRAGVVVASSSPFCPSSFPCSSLSFPSLHHLSLFPSVPHGDVEARHWSAFQNSARLWADWKTSPDTRRFARFCLLFIHSTTIIIMFLLLLIIIIIIIITIIIITIIIIITAISFVQNAEERRKHHQHHPLSSSHFSVLFLFVPSQAVTHLRRSANQLHYHHLALLLPPPLLLLPHVEEAQVVVVCLVLRPSYCRDGKQDSLRRSPRWQVRKRVSERENSNQEQWVAASVRVSAWIRVCLLHAFPALQMLRKKLLVCRVSCPLFFWQ